MQPTWGVISDVDDTIIQTQTDTFFRLLVHTFLTHPKIVTGMPELFDHIRVKLANPCFWYLSASPYNLLPYLRSPPDLGAYSAGRLILPSRKTALMFMLPSFNAIRNYKLCHLEKIHSTTTFTKVICLGDSQQWDPEVYGEAFRRYPHWIDAIFIRIPSLNRRHHTPRRFQRAFADVPRDVWHIFCDPNELYHTIDCLGSRTQEN